MGRLSQFRRVPGFGMEDLVSVANGLLADRPDLLVSRRTVRFYVSEGWVPAPSGSPKFARYPYEALALVVGLRRLQDRGWSLPLAAAEVQRRLAEGSEDELLGEENVVALAELTPGCDEVVEAPPALVAEPIVRYRFGEASVELPQTSTPLRALKELRKHLDSYLTLNDSDDV